MKRQHIGCVLIVGWILLACLVAPGMAAEQQASLVLRFATGKAFLGDDSKANLRLFFKKYEIIPKSRVFVVGYTDSIGDKGSNYRLSRGRAQAIRREIISAFGLNAAVVMAMGKGEENPVGDNRRASGRASNRRAEIYLANARIRKPKRVYGPGDPHLSEIRNLVKEAHAMIKKRELGEAVKLLKKAHGIGGDHYSDWHAAYGIAGFYANTPYDETSAHLATALQLDPYNYLAREYQGRMAARRNVLRGVVTREMGGAAADAIPVTAVVQQHEYLRLFNVAPMRHRKVEGWPVDAWECLDAQGVPVTYYFDYTRVYGWAFSKPAGSNGNKPVPGQSGPPRDMNAPSAVSSQDTESPAKSVSNDANKIWQSKIFK